LPTEHFGKDWSQVAVFGERIEGCTIRPSAYALLEDAEGRVAVVRSADGTFLPGGGIEPGETPEEAIRREGMEECGFIIQPGAWLVRAVQFSYSRSEKTYFEKRSIFVEGTILASDSSRLEADHELIWIKPEAANEFLSHTSHCWAVGQWQARAPKIGFK
jgi:8-oxo-dGTP diphosphatase